MNKKNSWLAALAVCLLLATLAPLASSAPDGLEKVAEAQGFSAMGRSSPFNIMADYVFPWIENEVLAAVMAGWLGTILVFILAYTCTRLICRIKDGPVRP